jgi:L-galactose dehydrogenase/L-glyceraldehyde 3-phosphate reductase
METRLFGRSGMHLSVLGFGCGAVGGLMVRGDPLDQERTIASAIAAGINYFDTAVLYGNGESEKNLGRVLRNLKASNVVIGTKVRLPSAEFGSIASAVTTSLEGSLTRLRRDRVDIFHLHNEITEVGGGKHSAPVKFSKTWSRRSSGCNSEVRHVSSGLPPSATQWRFAG